MIRKLGTALIMVLAASFLTGDLFAGTNVVAPSRKASTGSFFNTPPAPAKTYTAPKTTFTPALKTTYTPAKQTSFAAPAPKPVAAPVAAPAAKKTPLTTVGLGAAQAQKRQESTTGYQAYKAEQAAKVAPPPVSQVVVKTPAVSQKIVVNTPAPAQVTRVTQVTNVTNVRNYGYNPNSWGGYHRSYYASYYSPSYHPPFYVRTSLYHDIVDTYFWYRLIDSMTAADQARWVYNHQAELDRQRIADLQANNAAFALAYNNLLLQKAAQDLNYQPAGVPLNQIYTEAYLKQQAAIAETQAAAQAAAVQQAQTPVQPAVVAPPAPAPVTPVVYVPVSQPAQSGGGVSTATVIVMILALGFLFALLPIWPDRNS